ncbi:hypothetical protein B0T24DRAFT_158514 [Lasiosphaeria ovina]|uniref:Uncharacterized protein n=1 Tax=Lasiosphaeria ovina TaxID=92902 RepID=A0AAE0KNP0_9PEZI|nr:hypothetical protein B0T24DRAFT_158514 [Lasiosphaeria ovina]
MGQVFGGRLLDNHIHNSLGGAYISLFFLFFSPPVWLASERWNFFLSPGYHYRREFGRKFLLIFFFLLTSIWLGPGAGETDCIWSMGRVYIQFSFSLSFFGPKRKRSNAPARHSPGQKPFLGFLSLLFPFFIFLFIIFPGETA